MKVVIDTNIIIDHLKGVPQATKQLKEIEEGTFTGLISTITIMELMAAPGVPEQRMDAIRELLDIFEHVPVNGQVASTAGAFLSKYRASHGLNPMDAIIAATAHVNEAVLFTLNKKHFRFIEGLVTVNPYIAND